MKASRRIGLGIVAACVTLLSAGCAAGQHAATAEESPAIDAAVGNSVGPMQIRGIAIEAPASGDSYGAGSSAAMTAVIVNSGRTNDTLTGITTTIAKGWGVYPTAGALEAAEVNAATGTGGTAAAVTSVPIAAGTSVGFGVPDSPQLLALTGLTGTVYTAQVVPVTLTFATAGSVTVEVPVQLSAAPGTVSISPLPSTP